MLTQVINAEGEPYGRDDLVNLILKNRKAIRAKKDGVADLRTALERAVDDPAFMAPLAGKRPIEVLDALFDSIGYDYKPFDRGRTAAEGAKRTFKQTIHPGLVEPLIKELSRGSTAAVLAAEAIEAKRGQSRPRYTLTLEQWLQVRNALEKPAFRKYLNPTVYNMILALDRELGRTGMIQSTRTRMATETNEIKAQRIYADIEIDIREQGQEFLDVVAEALGQELTIQEFLTLARPMFIPVLVRMLNEKQKAATGVTDKSPTTEAPESPQTASVAVDAPITPEERALVTAAYMDALREAKAEGVI